MSHLVLSNRITIEDVYRVATGEWNKVELDSSLVSRINASRRTLKELLNERRIIYGVNTGFGKLASVRISLEKIKRLQVNILRSHATGSGTPLPEEVVRAMLLLRAFSLSMGYSGVRIDVINRLLDFINWDMIPVVPEYGSVGASGDLVPLAHLALPIIGEGEVFLRHKQYPSLIAHRMLNIEPLELEEKEGLALVNGLQYTQALLLLAYERARLLFDEALTIFLLSFWAAGSRTDAFSPVLKRLKDSPGFHYVIDYIHPHLDGFEPYEVRVQDPYSIRVVPQVYGAIKDNLDYISTVLEREINSANDNPLIVDGDVYSTGMFHGEALSFASDLLHMSMTEMASISERRSYFLLDKFQFLTPDPGLNSGFMIAHVSQASIVSYMKSHAFPSSVDNIPTSGGQEDFVSMSSNSALRTYRMVNRLLDVLAWELYMALQALTITKRYSILPQSLRRIYDELIHGKAFRVKLPQEDIYMHEEFQKLRKALASGHLLVS